MLLHHVEVHRVASLSPKLFFNNANPSLLRLPAGSLLRAEKKSEGLDLAQKGQILNLELDDYGLLHESE